MDFGCLRDSEFQAKLRAAKTPEELLTLAREQGYELSEDQLQALSGGMQWRCTDEECGAYYPCPADMPA